MLPDMKICFVVIPVIMLPDMKICFAVIPVTVLPYMKMCCAVVFLVGKIAYVGSLYKSDDLILFLVTDHVEFFFIYSFKDALLTA
jgi:hypothetical protein